MIRGLTASYAFIILYCVILRCMICQKSETHRTACYINFTDVVDEYQYFQDGDVIIGAVITVKSEQNFLGFPGTKFYRLLNTAFLNFLAFLTAIDHINQDPSVLPNVTLGYHVFDSWREPRKAVQNVLQILSGPEKTIPNYSCRKHGKLAGVIGDYYSSTTIPIAQILGLYRYTQITYGTTDYILSNRQLYPHIFRTVQNDHVHYLAIAKLVKHFGWTWVGILFSDNDNGENEAKILKVYLRVRGICVAFETRIRNTHAALNQWGHTLKRINCKVVILCGFLTGDVFNFLLQYIILRLYSVFILPPAWAVSDIRNINNHLQGMPVLALKPLDLQIQRDESLFDNKILLRHSQSIRLMDEHTIILYNMLSSQNRNNLYFRNVTVDYSQELSITDYIRKMNKKLFNGEPQRLYFAVEAMAESIYFIYKFRFNEKRFKLQKYMKKIKHSFEMLNRDTFFDENGEFPTPYKIVNMINTDFKNDAKDVGLYIPWVKEEDQLHINESQIIWRVNHNQAPQSYCSNICLPGYRKKSVTLTSCCYECVPCSEGEISIKSDSVKCMTCREDEWPNEKRNQCLPKPLEFLSYTDDISKVFMTISIFFCIVTLLVMGIFRYHIDTPVVKANNRNLSFVLLISILLSFLCVFLFIGRPLDITCILRVTTFGVLFSIAVSSLLAKTIIVYVAFKVTKPGIYWRRWIGSKLPICIVSVFSSVQGLICLVWLSVSHPFKEMDSRSYQDKIVIQCNEGSVIGFYSVLGYLGFLAALSFFLAFMVRRLPDSFNEAKYITFSMLVFFNVWIALIPAYLSTKGKFMVAVEVFALCASSAGLLSCIFFPKCFIILFKAEVNIQTHFLQNNNRY